MPQPTTAVAHRRELADRGVDEDRVRRAVRSGRWLEPVPGVIVQHSGSLTRRERHLESAGFVVVHQTRRPLGDLELAGLPVTRAARAAVDVAVCSHRRADVEHVVSDVLQEGLTDVAELAAETRALGRRATPWLRQTLTDSMRGMRSVGEADLRRVVLAERLPEPEWNAEVETPFGVFHLDAYWRRQRLGAEADGTAFHLSARDWQLDLRRQNAVQGTGIRLLRFPVPRLRSEGYACGREIRAALGV